MTTAAPLALQLWYSALHDPRGIFITTTDPVRLKSLLYTARTRAADPALFSLMIRTSPSNPTGELWIIQTANPTVSEG